MSYPAIYAASKNETAPLTLERLQKMDGEPVLFSDEWYLVWVDDNQEVWLQRPMTLGCPSKGLAGYYEVLTRCIRIDMESLEE